LKPPLFVSGGFFYERPSLADQESVMLTCFIK